MKNQESNLDNLKLNLLEKEFSELSKEFLIKKERYDKKVKEIEEQIKKLEAEITEIENEIETEDEVVLSGEKLDDLEHIKDELVSNPELILGGDLELVQKPKVNLQEEINIPKPIVTKEIEEDNINQTEIVGLEEEKEEKEENKIDVEISEIIKELPTEKRVLLEESMAEIKLEPFEPLRTKKSLKDFIKNQIVKKVSDFSVPEKSKEIINKILRRVLLTSVVMSLWVNESGGGSNCVASSGTDGDFSVIYKNSIEKEISKYKTGVFSLTENNFKTYEKLPQGVKNIYLYSLNNVNDSYIVVDKPTARLFIIDSNKNLVTDFPVLLGQTKGESKNIANSDSDIAIGATTPAGKYRLTNLYINKDDSVMYQGRILSLLGQGQGGLAIHMTYPLEIEKRSKALETETTEDNRMSWGCINISLENWDNYIKPYFNTEKQFIFITPDNPNLLINPETGLVENDPLNITSNYLASN
jgi:hypothetical protein